MKRVSLANAHCPIARALDLVGDWWSILILRDALDGASRFDDFQTGLPISPTILTRRLNALVEGGMLERRRYSDRPPRDAYHLTDRGRDFEDVVNALLAWGNRHLAQEGCQVTLINRTTGTEATPEWVDTASGLPINASHFERAPGAAAAPDVHARYQRLKARRTTS